MKLDPVALHDACRSLALASLKQNERATETVETAAALYFSICELKVPQLEQRSRDPNMLTRAVRYLTHFHAIPLGTDPAWFQESLTILIELASPSRPPTHQGAAFLEDLASGIEISVVWLEA